MESYLKFHTVRKPIFNGIESPYSVVRYHSLVIEKDSLPNELEITAVLEENPDVIMAIEHKDKPIYGVQFHPESIETGHGMKLIEKFFRVMIKEILNKIK